MNTCKSSETVYSSTAPDRIFLCDVAKRAKQSSSNRLFRLMGTIVEIIPQQHASSSEDQLISFVIDDGSGTAPVFTRRRLDTTCSSSKAEVPLRKNIPQHLKQSQKIQYNNDASSPAPTPKSAFLPLPVLKLGQTVDCIGVFHFESRDTSRDELGISGEADGNQFSNDMIIWLAASAVSIVTNPQEVSLRQIELSSASSENSQHTKQMDSRLDRKPVNDCLPKNRIVISKNLSLKLNSVICNGGRLQQQEQQFMLAPDDAFRYINHSKDDGGISASDLALLVGATKMKDKMMVKGTVEHLQNVGMIYMKQGKYFPL